MNQFTWFLWHRITGRHEWRERCLLCDQVRWHGDSGHEVYLRCSCGLTRPASSLRNASIE